MDVNEKRDREYLLRAHALAADVAGWTSPNPWVGAVLVTEDGTAFDGVTSFHRGPHAEALALAGAAENHSAREATMYVTLEPCAHIGHNPSCADALIQAGVARVVVGIVDPDARTNGAGIERLRKAGISVELMDPDGRIAEQLAPFLKHRRTGRPWVVLKLASTFDGRICASDGTSKWITGAAARADVHELRSRCDAIVVGAGTVRSDDPSLTVRDINAPIDRQPFRVVLGSPPRGAKVQPALEWHGELDALLDELGSRGFLQVLVEGGANVAGAFHRAELVDSYVFYVAPKLLGGDGGLPLMAGAGASTIQDAWKGRIVDVRQLGDDLRVRLSPHFSTEKVQ